MADVALAALGVLVRENDLAGGAVVNKGLVPESETMLKHLQEDPLGPLIVVLICRVYYTGPVERETDLFQLAGETVNVHVRDLARMHAGLNGIVLGGKTKRVKSDGEQDIVALHASFPAYDLKAGVGLDMSDVHAGARGIGELNEAVELGFVTVILRVEDTGLLPFLLPFRLDVSKIVWFHLSTFL